jgi:hypothetical protein
MRASTFGLAAVAATLALASTATANLLTNPGFESPTIVPPPPEYYGAGDGWTAFNGVFTVSSAVVAPNTGDQSLKTFGGGANGAFQQFPTLPGQLWDGGVHMLNWSGDQMANGQVGAVNLEWIQADGITNSAITPFISNGTFTAAAAPVDQWTLQPISGIAPADAAFVRLVVITGDFLPGGPGGAVFFDDAFLVPTPGALACLGMGGLVAVRRRRR